MKSGWIPTGRVALIKLFCEQMNGLLWGHPTNHSFFGPEWQKRWCVLNNSIFYYFGTEKDKQQKGSFHISEYSVQLVNNLRKDKEKKNACFELTAPGRRAFQFAANSLQEAREWVDQINFVLRDLSSSVIPEDEDEEEEGEEGEEETYDDIEGDFPSSAEEAAEKSSEQAGSSDYANYYQGLWDCQADEPDELTFQRGDLIYIISKILWFFWTSFSRLPPWK
ncbi:unnamed protein product [Menidia menidia]|uniref:Src kinase-associated phosphoprotein 1 n=1 Tax=Menidia menidia TaxID=238744 RepID=A0A8S4AUR2_9TELE|nr:unnamed protein product [Menidia menidia]